MKYLLMRITGTFMAVFFMIIVCSGCSVSNKSSDISDKREIKIGVTVYNIDDPFISSLAQNLEQMAKERENKDKIKINLTIADAKGSSVTQNNAIDTFINQDYDVICVNIVDRTTASVIIDKGRKANKPIIFFNREPVEEDLNIWDKVYYVGAKSEQSGEMQADILTQYYRENPQKVDKNNDGILQYVMLEGEPEHQDALIRTEYCIKTIEKNNIEVEKLADDSANWQSAQAYEKMTQWLNEFGDKIEVVFSNNDDMALGAIKAMDDAQIDLDKRPVVLGVDAVPAALDAIKNGTMIGTVFNNNKLQAKYVFNIAYDLAFTENVLKQSDVKNSKYVKTSYEKVDNSNFVKYMKK